MGIEQGVLKHQQVTDTILKTFYAVYNELGFGFLETVYENALAIALREAGLVAVQQVPIAVSFHGQQVGDFRCDILVEKCVILELKAAREIVSVHLAQTLNYLKATEIEVALILNFGEKPSFKRLAFDNRRKNPPGRESR